MRRLSSRTFLERFQDKAARHWTKDRVHGLTSGKDLALSPDKPGVPALLRLLGFLDSEARLVPNSLHKYKQINAVFGTVESALTQTLRSSSAPAEPLRMLEMAAGNSNLSLLMAFAALHRWRRAVHIVAVDRCEKRVALAAERASILGLDASVRYKHCAIEEMAPWPDEYLRLFPRAGGKERGRLAVRPPQVVLALHACDVATDHALSAGIAARADLLAVIPCCQAELAEKWAAKKRHSRGQPGDGFSLVHQQPHLRQETAAHITDALRVALLRSHGYVVAVSDFVSMEHTRKSRMLLATRAPLSDSQRDAAWDEHDALKHATGGEGILLEELLLMRR